MYDDEDDVKRLSLLSTVACPFRLNPVTKAIANHTVQLVQKECKHCATDCAYSHINAHIVPDTNLFNMLAHDNVTRLLH